MKELSGNKIFARQASAEWMRYWGKYSKPFECNIFINEMCDVKKHSDCLPVKENVSIGSSLLGGTYAVEVYHG